jgi:prolyl-tRNA editing enzyme YbaK/EbsC (Cys-tRNA(Pro) deacylase)
MHGDKHVSTKALARFVSTKQITPCAPLIAQKHPGYKIGGTSPFGTRSLMARMAPEEVVRILNPVMVKVSI